jgi:Domain of unknown function (DUF4390)
MRMMTRRNSAFRAIWILLLIVVSSAPALVAQESLRITPFVRDNQVLVSFTLNDAYNDAIHEAIASGLRTTFTYELELRTVVPGWIDRTIAHTTVATSDQYDNLTRRHTLTRTVDGRVEEVTVAEDEAVVKKWLTEWTRVQVCDTSKLDATRDYYVRITTRTRPVGGSLLGLTRSVSGQAKFTFIP